MYVHHSQAFLVYYVDNAIGILMFTTRIPSSEACAVSFSLLAF